MRRHLIVAALFALMALGCRDDAGDSTKAKHPKVEINAPGVDIHVDRNKEGGGVHVDAPGVKVDVKKKD